MEIRKHLTLVTGMSGGGRSTALSALDDLGHTSIDNLPLELWSQLVTQLVRDDSFNRLAIGFNTETRGFSEAYLAELLAQFRALEPVRVRLVYLDAEDTVLLRRFSETRRRHPLAHDRPPADGIEIERKRSAQTRSLADELIDTTTLRPQDLRQLVQDLLPQEADDDLAVFVQSFSYKVGLPRSADLVFDVRFLRNPHYEPSMRFATGKEAQVGAYIEEDAAYEAFTQRLSDLLQTLLPRYRAEGKSYLNLAFGCTGGRHRSVYLARVVRGWLEDWGYRVQVRHRELDAQSANERLETISKH